MSFIAPGFLLGLGLLALPWWLHRLKVQSAERQPFASLQLMQPAQERKFTERRIRFRPLLAIRMALLAALALAFAGPWFESADLLPPEPAQQPEYLLVDRSASMERALSSGALGAAARTLLDSLPAGTEPGLLVAGREVEERLPAGAGSEAVLAAISGSLSSDQGHLEFDRMLRQLAAHFTDERGRPTPARIHLLSDFQASGVPPQFSRLAPSAHLELTLNPVPDLAQDNWSVTRVDRAGDQIEIIARGAGPAVTASVWLNQQPLAAGLNLAATGDRGSLKIAAPFLPGENRVVVRLAGDALESDNEYFAVLNQGAAWTVPLLTDEGSSSAAVYLRTALEAVGGAQRFAPQPVGEFDPRTLSRHRWLAITDLGAVPPAVAQALSDWLESGGRLLAALGPRIQDRETVPVTGHRLNWQVALDPDRGLEITGLWRGHPLLGPADGWQDVSVRRVAPVQLLEGDEALVRLSGGQPLLVNHPRGSGQVALLASDLGRAWNDLPARPVFVPWIAALAQSLSGHATLVRQRFVGDAVRPGADSRALVAPGGGELFGLEARGPVVLDETGFYELYDAQSNMTTIAVNVDARESDLRPMAPDQVDAWRQMLGRLAPMDARAAELNRPPERNEFFWLLLLLVLLTGESIVGNRHLRAASP